MAGKCKMTGNEKVFPCSAAGCPLFGDCLVEYEKEHKKNTAKPRTNADRIRAMSDEELAHFMSERSVNESTVALLNKEHGLSAIQIAAVRNRVYCALLQWLKQPAKDGV